MRTPTTRGVSKMEADHTVGAYLAPESDSMRALSTSTRPRTPGLSPAQVPELREIPRRPEATSRDTSDLLSRLRSAFRRPG